MKIKRLYKSHDYILFVVFLLIEFRIFYIVPLPEILGGAASNKLLPALVASIVFCLYVAKRKVLPINRILLSLFLLLLWNGIWEYIRFDYPLTTIVWPMLPYLILLMYFPLTNYLKMGEQAYKQVLHICEAFSSVASLLLIIQCLLYNCGYKTIFLNVDVKEWYTLYHPSELLRIYGYLDGIIRVTVLMSAFELIKNNFRWKDNKLHLMSFITTLAGIIYVDRSRTYFLLILIACIYMFVKLNHIKIRKRALMIGIVGIVIACIAASTRVSSILESIADPTNGSSYARAGGILHYLFMDLEYSLTGMGLVISEEYSEAFALIKGNMYIYNYDDVGIFGVYGSLGLFGVLWYISFLIDMIRKISYQKKAFRSYVILRKALILMMILSSFTMSYIDPCRLPALLLTMTIVNSDFDRCENEREKCVITYNN